MRVVVIVTVDEVPGFRPVTVTKPDPLIETDPPAEFVPAHVYVASKLVICNWKPVAVPVSILKDGVSAEPLLDLYDNDVAVPVSKPVRVV